MSKNYIVGKYELDDHQMKLLNCDTNSIVIAGAGSGKTLTILGKVNYLIEKMHIKPESILLISFTNASVNDVKERLNYNAQVFTFHKLAMHILEVNNITYSICNARLLNYLIKEYLKVCSKKEQKYILKFLKINITFSAFLLSPQFENFCNLIETFINFYKTNNYSYKDISKIYYSKLEKEILLIIFKIYQIYITEKNSTNTLDFDDLISYATKYASNTKLNYKYIIIDEFQDTSLVRLNLIKKIYNNEDAKIIVVGDDWQSIYHFSGCDLNIFLNFENYFPNVQEVKLVNTYRNSQELIKIAAEFVEKNPSQIKKDLISSKHHNTPLILAPYHNKKTILKELLNTILLKSNDILILSRNNNDIQKYLDKDMLLEKEYITYKDIKIRYLTVHRSKGLEAEYVIILNCNDEKLGFPNKIENNRIIEKLFPNEIMPFAEERRLFYVAITRCKECTYLVYDKKNPSIFIREIKKIIKKNLKQITYF